MNKISLNVEMTWENKDEFQQIMNKVNETKEAYEKALEAAENFVPKMINLQTIHMLTSGGKIDPDIYKGMLELIEPAKKGEYQAYDVFTVVDSTKEEDGEAGEGNLVFVHVNEAFEYDKQTLEELESEAKVTVIKYADLVKQD